MACAAVLIDLDGTLWDSAPWYATLIEVGEEGQAKLASQLADPAGGLRVAALLKDRGITPARFSTACASHRIPLYPNAREVLVELGQDAKLGVVTNLPAWMAEPMLDSTKLSGLFSAVQCAQRGVPSKPSPTGLHRVLSALGADKDSAVYVGDTAVDEEAARRADIRFAFASWGYGQATDPGQHLGDWTDLRHFA